MPEKVSIMGVWCGQKKKRLLWITVGKLHDADR